MAMIWITSPTIGLWLKRRSISWSRSQSPEGDIRWTAPDPKTPEDDALVTGNSSIHKSLLCAEKLAVILGHEAATWTVARLALADALAHKPHRFDRTWPPKTRYSMDWYYPVLSGALSQAKRGRASPRAGMIS